LPVLRPAKIEGLRAAEEGELKAADKLLLVLARGKQPSARAAGVEAGLGKSAACDAVRNLKVQKLIKGLPAGAIKITEVGRKYVKDEKLEAADVVNGVDMPANKTADKAAAEALASLTKSLPASSKAASRSRAGRRPAASRGSLAAP
jgi:hypothetical protein